MLFKAPSTRGTIAQCMNRWQDGQCSPPKKSVYSQTFVQSLAAGLYLNYV